MTEVTIVNGSNTNTQTTAEPSKPEPVKPPEGIPEKFWDAEKKEVRVADMAKSFVELEKLHGKTTQELQALKAPKETKQDPAKESQSNGATASADFAALTALRNQATQEFAQSGAVSDETKEALAKSMGISAQDVDIYIEGTQALLNKTFQDIGGTEGLKTLKEWVAKNYSAEELANYNKAASRGGESSLKAVREAHQKMIQAEGYEGTTYSGSGPSAPDVFNDVEAKAAFADPRYGTDKLYTSQVQAKFARTFKHKGRR